MGPLRSGDPLGRRTCVTRGRSQTEGVKHPLCPELLGPIGGVGDARVCDVRGQSCWRRGQVSLGNGLQSGTSSWGHACWRDMLGERLGRVWASIFCLHPHSSNSSQQTLGRAQPAPRTCANSIQAPAPG